MNETTKQELNGSKSRYEKGLELYKAGKVSIGNKGLSKVSGYCDVDTEKMTCTCCPDYKGRKEPCKHLFAAMLFVKNRGKQIIEGLENSHAGIKNGSGANPQPESKEVPDKPQEAHSKEFDRQATYITRLAVLNTATEILKIHRNP